jgi:hypothetical protein
MPSTPERSSPNRPSFDDNSRQAPSQSRTTFRTTARRPPPGRRAFRHPVPLRRIPRRRRAHGRLPAPRAATEVRGVVALATRRPRRVPEVQGHAWSGRRDSNPRPSPWQGDGRFRWSPMEPLESSFGTAITAGTAGTAGVRCIGVAVGVARTWTELAAGPRSSG